MKSIFIMSSERSGSNLVREILNCHPNISAPPAAQLPRYLSMFLPYYDDLAVDENMNRMKEDALQIINLHPNTAELHFPVEEINNFLTERSMWGLIAAIYTWNAQKQGKTAWVSKDNDLFNYVYEIKRTLPDARFIYLFRDGRDYVCSVRKMGIPNAHIYSIAKQWQREQQACLKVYYSFREAADVHLLRYEDLLVEPETTLRKLCNFLEEPYHEEMLDFHSAGSAQRLSGESAYWQNLSKPLMKANFAKFKQELRPREIAFVESIMGRELAFLGYPRQSAAPSRAPSAMMRLWYSLQNSAIRFFKSRKLKNKEGWRAHRNAVSRNIMRQLADRPPTIKIAKMLNYD